MEEGLVEAIQKYGNKNVVEENIGVVSTKNCRSCYLHDGILHDGIHAETKKIHLPKASDVLSFTPTYSKPMNILLEKKKKRRSFLYGV